MPSAISRGFAAIREGQAHYRSCGNASLPCLVMFHKAPGSSYSLIPLMAEFARYRRVIAIDTLGNGDSAAPAMEEPDIAYLADAHVRALDALDIARADIYGSHTGASICAEISINHPKRVARIIMDGVSLFDGATQDMLLNGGQAPEIRADLAGTHLLKAWSMVRDSYLFWPWWSPLKERRRDKGLPPADKLHEEVVEVLKALSTYHKSYRAALRYPKEERLALVRHPTLIACSPYDTLRRYFEAVVAIMPDARSLITAGEETPENAASTARSMAGFLDEKR